MFIKFKNQEYQYKLLNILEFTSDRKRMSVIVEDQEGKIMLLTKGADSIIQARLSKEKSPFLDQTLEYIEEYA